MSTYLLNTTLAERKPEADSDWVETPYPNLIRYKPSGNYFGRVRVNGKLIRRSLATHVLSVAKLKVSDFLPGTVWVSFAPTCEPFEWCDIWISHANETNLPRVLLIGDSIARDHYPEVEKRERIRLRKMDF